MERNGSALGRMCVVAAGLVALAWPAEAETRVSGLVTVRNPVTGTTEPVVNARVRLYMREYVDLDTLDPESLTGPDGRYSFVCHNAWFVNAYACRLAVYAEFPNQVEIQRAWLQDDGYQAWSPEFLMLDNGSLTHDIVLHETRSTGVERYLVGGTAGLYNPRDVEGAILGTPVVQAYCNPNLATMQEVARAFFILNEMTDMRVRLRELGPWFYDRESLGPNPGNFSTFWEEKEVSYPLNIDVSNFMPVDYIRHNDRMFEHAMDAADTIRHEYSHALMADAYGMLNYPGASHFITDFDASRHTMKVPNRVAEWAWSEGWAEFLATFTLRMKYGRVFTDLETADGRLGNYLWRQPLTLPFEDRWNVEGEIAGALWDMMDGVGWEKQTIQYPNIPGEELFFDGLSDEKLEFIWPMMVRARIDMFVCSDDNIPEDDDSSLVYRWLQQRPGDRHAMRAILYNRGIVCGENERPPQVSVESVTWSNSTARVRVQVTDPDEVDRPYVRVELYHDGIRRDGMVLTSGWNGDTATVELLYEHRQGVRVSPTGGIHLMVAAHDDMLSTSVTHEATNAPPGALVSRLLCEVRGVSVYNDNLLATTPLRDVVVQVSGPPPAAAARIPEAGALSVPPGEVFRRAVQARMFDLSDPNLPPELVLRFSVRGVMPDLRKPPPGEKQPAEIPGLPWLVEEPPPAKPSAELGWAEVSVRRSSGYDLGLRTLSIPLGGDRTGCRADIAYSLTSPMGGRLLEETALRRGLRDLAAQLSRPAVARVQAKPDKPSADSNRNPVGVAHGAAMTFDELRRVQSAAIELAAELEARLDANLSRQLRESEKTKAQFEAPFGIKVGGVEKRVIKGVRSDFLDAAAQGQNLVTELNEKQREALIARRAEAEQLLARIGKLSVRGKQAGRDLPEILKLVESKEVKNPAVRAAARPKLVELSSLMEEVEPGVRESEQLVRKSIEVIDRALQGGKAPPAAPVASVVSWRVSLEGAKQVPKYTEEFYAEKRAMEPRGEDEVLWYARCRMTNLAKTPQTPILTERLCGKTALVDAAGTAIAPATIDARQASNKWQGYEGVSVAGGEAEEFAIVFRAPAKFVPQVLRFSMLTYPNDVGQGDGVVVEIRMPGAPAREGDAPTGTVVP